MALAGLAFTACYSNGDGIAPPLSQIYFPVGVATSPDQSRLYVVSSDFDLQYNAGALHSLDLKRVRQLVPRDCDKDADCVAGERCDAAGDSASHWCVAKAGKFAGKPCGALGERAVGERIIVPGRCNNVDLTSPQMGGAPVQVDSVELGAFASDLVLRQGPKGEQRLFIPVRGESSLHWIDVDKSGGLHCGQEGSGSCDSIHRAGLDSSDNSRGLRMPPEPFGIAVSAKAEAIAITHQTSGAVSLFTQDLAHWSRGPELEFILQNLPLRPVALAAVPRSLASDLLEPSSLQVGFLTAYRDTPQVDLLRYYPDAGANPSRPFLALAGSAQVRANLLDYDSRGIAVDGSERADCEASCAGESGAKASACALSCANVPLGVFLSSRSPASLISGFTQPDTWATPNRDLPRFSDVVALPYGPSRVEIGKIMTSAGKLETRVFILCFDARRLAVYDPTRRLVERWITTGRGPHALSFDYQAPDPSRGEPGHALAYLAHFTDSYLGVLQLDQRARRTYGEVVLGLAPVTAPRASK